MTEDERRRYFRINETVGIAYQLLDTEKEDHPLGNMPDVLELVSKQDKQIERLLLEVEEEHPKVAELITVFNQKLERVVSQLMLESQLVDRIAQRVKEANISACGIAFSTDEAIDLGACLTLELTLYPSDKAIQTKAIVVGCEPAPEGDLWFWRLDFFNMSEKAQETLIQHIVQRQSQQIKDRKKS